MTHWGCPPGGGPPVPADRDRVQTLFLAAADLADPAARAAYLDMECRGDAALRARVEALLRAHDQPDSLLDAPAVARLASAEGGPDPTHEFRTPAASAPGDGPTHTKG